MNFVRKIVDKMSDGVLLRTLQLLPCVVP